MLSNKRYIELKVVCFVNKARTFLCFYNCHTCILKGFNQIYIFYILKIFNFENETFFFNVSKDIEVLALCLTFNLSSDVKH